jgi:hypothetical protein
LWKRARISHKDKQDLEVKAIKQADLDMLELAADMGEIHLKYLDETGFSCWSPVQYGWIKKGQSKRFEQTASKGKRVSLLGVFQPEIGFDGVYRVGSMTSQEYILFMDKQAELAADLLVQTNAFTVIGQDNSSTHTCKAVKAKIKDWQGQGLVLFQLPPYCSEMNPIELEWQHLKRDELSGRMFNSEDELGLAIESALHSRYDSNGFDASYSQFSYA